MAVFCGILQGISVCHDNMHSLQMFHLVKFEGEGGKTVIVDGFKVAQELRNTYPEVYHFFLTTPIPFHYIDKDHYFYHKKPIFEHSENGELLRVSFNNDDRATVDLPSEQVKINIFCPLNHSRYPLFTNTCKS